MKGFILLSAVLQLTWCYGSPAVNGVGAYAYQDSTGRRYGGTYDIGPDELGPENNFIGPLPDFQNIEAFYPYFRNFENFLQEAFGSHIANQRIPFYAAQRVYDLTPYYSFGRISPFFRFSPFGEFPRIKPPTMPNFGGLGSNSAFSRSIAGPGHIQQTAAISPASNRAPNVNVLRSGAPSGDNNFYGVSSSSYVSSSNVNGQQATSRKAETVVNENGRVTRYKVED